MTEDKKELYGVSDFVRDMNEAEVIARLSENRSDELPDVKKKADKALRNIAYAHLSKQKGFDSSRKSPEELTSEEIENNSQQLMIMANSRSLDKSHKSLADWVEDASESELEIIAGRRELLAGAKGKNRETLGGHAGYTDLKEFLERYKTSGQVRDEQEEKVVRNAIAIGAGKAERERLIELGYTDIDVLSNGEKLGQVSASTGLIDEKTSREYAMEGIKKRLEEAEKGIDKEKIIGAVRESIKSLANSGNTKEIKLGRDLFYAAITNNTGYLDKRYKEPK